MVVGNKLPKFDVFGIKTVAGTGADRKSCFKMNARQGLGMIPLVGIFTGARQIYDACKHEVDGVDMGSKGGRIFRAILEIAGAGSLCALADIFKSIFFPQKAEKIEISVKENPVEKTEQELVNEQNNKNMLFSKYKFEVNPETPWEMIVSGQSDYSDAKCKIYQYALSDSYINILDEEELKNKLEEDRKIAKESVDYYLTQENPSEEDLFNACLFYSWLTIEKQPTVQEKFSVLSKINIHLAVDSDDE